MFVASDSSSTKPMARVFVLGLAAILFTTGCGGGTTPSAPSGNAAPVETAAEPDPGTEPAEPEMIARALKPFTGDYDALLERRVIRVLVPYTRTLYFVDDHGRERGAAHDSLVEFEKILNEQLGDKSRPIQVLRIPVRRDQLFEYLKSGRGDLALGNITITPERRQLADFSSPILTNVREVVVTAAGEPPVASANELAGREVYVRKSSSYFTHLSTLNEELKGAGKPTIDIRTVDESLEDEDLLELVNAGAFPATVVDDHLAKLWLEVFTDARLQPEAAVNAGGSIAWAIRKDCPKLTEVVNAFIASHAKGTAFGNMLMAKYFANAKWLKNSTSEQEMAKLRATVELFQKYGKQYDFDWLMIAAQAYQESGIDQSVRSPVGAVGVMQVLPTTAAGNPININDIDTNMENNIHAGVKYMRFMMDEYFKDAQMDDVNKCLFAFASYNGGPAKIARLRKEAEARGLDPNKWFQNVELVVAQRIGRETVTYVKNIYKYYVAYKLVMERRTELDRMKKAAKTG
ncbi:MAG: lytic transglycosylase F [Blastocatellia bacterium]|nr:lytic transglycosylase F [Blastocatellia bacterium]